MKMERESRHGSTRKNAWCSMTATASGYWVVFSSLRFNAENSFSVGTAVVSSLILAAMKFFLSQKGTASGTLSSRSVDNRMQEITLRDQGSFAGKGYMRNKRVGNERTENGRFNGDKRAGICIWEEAVGTKDR